MGKHRTISEHSLRSRTVIGGVLVSGALLVGAPAATALASPASPGSHRDHEIGAAVTKFISHLPPQTQVKLFTAISKLPPRDQARIGKIAGRLGEQLPPAH